MSTQDTNSMLRITNGNGIPFNVRMIFKGDRYGRDDILVHDKDDPLVEFYDARLEDNPDFKNGRGQFVSRYYFETLKTHVRRHGHNPGLNLEGRVDAWQISGRNMLDVMRWARESALERLGAATSSDYEQAGRAITDAVNACAAQGGRLTYDGLLLILEEHDIKLNESSITKIATTVATHGLDIPSNHPMREIVVDFADQLGDVYLQSAQVLGMVPNQFVWNDPNGHARTIYDADLIEKAASKLAETEWHEGEDHPIRKALEIIKMMDSASSQHSARMSF